jgi:hypothetical protein
MENSGPMQSPSISFLVIGRQSNSEKRWLFLESQYCYHRRKMKHGGPEKNHILARITLPPYWGTEMELG